MNIPVSRIKVTAPRRRSDLLSRPRLTLLFDELLENKLILVSAPAGFGKTSLFIDLAQSHVFPYCWYSLDETDQDIYRFIAHLAASIEERFPGFEEACKDSLQAAFENNAPPRFLSRLFAEEVFQHVREHMVIILDDYHKIDHSENINAFINHFVQDVDENVHVVLLSRALFEFDDLPLMVARSQVGGLGYQELAFRPDEIQSLLLQNYRQVIPDTLAVELATQTEGWITGLLLSAQTMWQGLADRERISRVSGIKLYDYLIHQILDQQPDDLRTFLLKTSLFDEFDAELCQEVFGPSQNGNWQDMIRRVIQYNLFVLPIDEDRTWLRYHQMFRDFLRAYLTKEFPEEEKHIIRSLAEVYTKRKDWDRAYACLQRLNDSEALVELLEKAGEPMVKSHQLTRLAEFLDSLPPDVLEGHPKLLARRGIVAATLGETHWGLSLLDQAVEALGSEADHSHLAGTLVWRALVHFIKGSHTDSLDDVEAVLKIAATAKIPMQFKAEALRIRGLNAWQLGNLPNAAEDMTESLKLYKTLDDTSSVTRLLLNLGPVYIESGQMKIGIAHLNSALETYREENNSYMLSGVLNDIAFVHYLHGEYDQADAAFEEALRHARSSNNRRVQALVLTGLGDLYIDLDALQAAETAYIQATHVAQGIEDQFMLLYLSVAQAGLARLQGDTHRSQRFLDSTELFLQNSESKYTYALHALEAGRLALACEDYPAAIQQIEKSVRLFDESGQKVEASRARFFLAAAHFFEHHVDQAVEHLQQAFQQAQSLENPHTLVPSGYRMLVMLENLKMQQKISSQVSALLESIEHFAQTIPEHRKRLRHQQSTRPIKTSRLQIQALGGVQVTLNRKPITSSDWQTQTNRDLFFLILSSENGWTKEAIGEQLWPGSSASQIRLRFKNAIYRVRRVLGQEAIQFDGDRYAFNRRMDYSYDVEHFATYLDKADHAASSLERIEAFREALKLYQGEFLPETDGTWAMIEREQLNRQFIETSLNLAKTSFETGEFNSALKVCNNVISHNPYLEEAYRVAMQIHAAQGNRAAIIKQYNQLKDSLMTQLGVMPSRQTENLYRELTQ